MFEAGLVSVSFRGYTVDQIVQVAAKADLKYIEWGSDVHAPCKDLDALKRIVALQKEYGIHCCSYGTYFRLGVTPLEQLPDYIRAAKVLNTTILRIWAGDRSPWKWTDGEKNALLQQCRQAASIAAAAGVTLCLECHRNTYTETKEAAMELILAADSPAFRMYWQPHTACTPKENIAYIRYMGDHTTHIHCYNWSEKGKYTLGDGIKEWCSYLKEFSGDHKVLLEFMPDNRIESLQREAEILRKIIASVQ